MGDLFVVSSLSDIYTEAIIGSSDRTVVVANGGLHKALMERGVFSLTLPQAGFSVKQRDATFAQKYMPGFFNDVTFLNTDLPLHKVLSIDRLRFWYNPNYITIQNILGSIRADRVYIDFNLQSIIPWIAANLFDDVVAYKTMDLLNRETVDFLPYAPISELVVSHDEEKEILQQFANVTSLGYPRPQRRQVEEEEKKKIRENLGIDEDAKVLGIVFDHRYDWKIANLLSELTSARDLIIFIYVANYFERQKMLNCVPNFFFRWLNIHTYDEASLMSACDEIVYPAYDERYLKVLPEVENETFADYGHIDRAYLFVK